MTEVSVAPPLFLPYDLAGAYARADVTAGYTGFLLLLFGILHSTGCALPAFPLSARDRGEWNVRVISTLNAIVCSFGSFLCLADNLGLTREECVYGFRPLPLFFARIFLGYLIFDLLLEICCGAPVLRNPTAVLHHLLWVFLNSYVLAYDVMPFTFSWLTLGEISTPCLNARWFLAVTKRESSRLYLLNGLALMVLFFLARILAYGLGLTHMWGLRDIYMAPGTPYMHTGIVVLASAGYALNIYWMGLIVKGAARAFKRKRK